MCKKIISYKNNIYKINVVNNKCSINNIPIDDFKKYDFITNLTCDFPEDDNDELPEDDNDKLPEDDNDELPDDDNDELTEYIDSNYKIYNTYFQKKYLKYKRKYLQLIYNR